MHSSSESCCGPCTDPASATLPSVTKLNLAGTPSNIVAQNKAIEARYGKPDTSPESMKSVPGDNFRGPGYAG